MKFWNTIVFVLILLPWTARADVNKVVGPLSCGIYDQSARPFIKKDLETQSADSSRYTMEILTKNGKKLRVEVKSVSIILHGERDHVSVFVDGKPFAKTSHQDVPLYFEVHVDGQKYRIMCIRTDEVVTELASPGPPSMPPGAASSRSQQ
ncbi:MAG TPA: hypothetical protein VLN91_03680 [Nitrospirota bacterium]|nr:hypothetical protein [Nitrospirota bacterium]